MRWFSTHESEQAGEMTWLSLIETAAATGIYVGIALWTGSLAHLAFAGCVAPLLLLKTDISQRRGLAWFARAAEQLMKPMDLLDRLFDWLPKTGNRVTIAAGWAAGTLILVLLFVFLILLGLFLAIAAFLCRVSATVTTVFTNPVLSIRTIPENWQRIVLCLDSHMPPEVVPGIESHPIGQSVPLFRFSDFIRQQSSSQSNYPNWSGVNRFLLLPLSSAYLYSAATLLVLLLFLPALVYRWSIKGTFVLYAPLVYIVWSAFYPTIPLKARLEEVRDGSYFRLMRWLSAGVIVLFLVKLYVHVAWTELSRWWTAYVPEVVSVYVAPLEIPLWQLAALLNAVLAFALLWFCEAALRRLEHGAWSPVTVERVLQVLSVVRGVIALYTIACTVYISVREARLAGKVKVVWELFPWWRGR